MPPYSSTPGTAPGTGSEMATERDKTPVQSGTRNEPATQSGRAEIDAFLQRARTLAPPVEAGKRGRLIFSLDATMSRQPTWDTACRLQGEMFREAGAIGGLDVHLVYFRGLNECRASRRARRRPRPRAMTEEQGGQVLAKVRTISRRHGVPVGSVFTLLGNVRGDVSATCAPGHLRRVTGLRAQHESSGLAPATGSLL